MKYQAMSEPWSPWEEFEPWPNHDCRVNMAPFGPWPDLGDGVLMDF